MDLLYWHDDSPALTTRINNALTRYRAKFGQAATVAYVPLAEYDESIEFDGVRITGRKDVLKMCVQVGRA